MNKVNQVTKRDRNLVDKVSFEPTSSLSPSVQVAIQPLKINATRKLGTKRGCPGQI